MRLLPQRHPRQPEGAKYPRGRPSTRSRLRTRVAPASRGWRRNSRWAASRSASVDDGLRTIRDAGGLLSADETPLVNDCACCALREDLVPELRRCLLTDAEYAAGRAAWKRLPPAFDTLLEA
jgi:hypothetical protein